jgi:hypothetical protein
VISTDVGATWNELAGNNYNSFYGNLDRTSLSVTVPGDSVVYGASATGCCNQADVFKSTDGGLTWIKLGVNSNMVPTNPYCMNY